MYTVPRRESERKREKRGWERDLDFALTCRRMLLARLGELRRQRHRVRLRGPKRRRGGIRGRVGVRCGGGRHNGGDGAALVAVAARKA